MRTNERAAVVLVDSNSVKKPRRWGEMGKELAEGSVALHCERNTKEVHDCVQRTHGPSTPSMIRAWKTHALTVAFSTQHFRSPEFIRRLYRIASKVQDNSESGGNSLWITPISWKHSWISRYLKFQVWPKSVWERVDVYSSQSGLNSNCRFRKFRRNAAKQL